MKKWDYKKYRLDKLDELSRFLVPLCIIVIWAIIRPGQTLGVMDLVATFLVGKSLK